MKNLTAPIKRAILDARRDQDGRMYIQNVPNSVKYAMHRRGFLTSPRGMCLLQPALDLLPALVSEPYPTRERCNGYGCFAMKEPDRECRWCKINRAARTPDHSVDIALSQYEPARALSESELAVVRSKALAYLASGHNHPNDPAFAVCEATDSVISSRTAMLSVDADAPDLADWFA